MQTINQTIYKFGTSGYRNNTDAGFNQAVVEQITHAIADVLIEQMTTDWQQVRPVLLGGDTRQKTKEAIPVIMAVLQARGLDVYQIEGDVPTPVLAYAAAYLKDLTGCDTPAAGAILMTASHNPWDYGGYNFLTPEGAVAPSSLSEQFEARQANPSNAVLNREGLGASATPFKRALQPYQAYYKHLKNRVGLSATVFEEQPIAVFYDPLYATGRHYFPKLMEDFGVIATTIHDDDNRPAGYTGEPEPSAEPSAPPAEPVEDFAGVVQPENVKIELPDLEEGGGASPVARDLEEGGGASPVARDLEEGGGALPVARDLEEGGPVAGPVDEAPVLGPAEETSQIQEPPLSQPLPPADEPQISRPPLPASSPAEEPETSHYLDEESPELAPSPAPRNSPQESADTRSAESHNANNLYPEGDTPDQA